MMPAVRRPVTNARGPSTGGRDEYAASVGRRAGASMPNLVRGPWPDRRRRRSGREWNGRLAGRLGRCAGAPRNPALGAPGHGRRCQARRRATRSARVGFDRSRSDRIGRPSAVAAIGSGQRHADRRVVPGKAELVAAVELGGHEVDQLERLESQEAVGHPGRDRRPTRRPPSSRVSTTAGPSPVAAGRTSTSATNARPGPRSSGRAGGGGSAGRAGRRPRRSTGWPGRSGRQLPPVQRGSRSKSAVARHSSRNEPRTSAWRTTTP